MNTARTLFTSCILGLLCCNPPIAPAAAPATATAPAAAAGHFGGPLSSAPSVPASAVLSEPAKYDGKTVKVSGLVGGVCQHKGCWMTLGTGQPGEPTVRVSFKDYGFFVPTDCMGKQAVVEGQFAVKTMSVGEAQHYAEDAARPGQKPQTVTAPQETLALVASGVELR